MDIEQLKDKYLIRNNINKFNTFMFFKENEICFHSNESTNLESRINKSMKFDEIIKSFNENNINYNIIKYGFDKNKFYIVINNVVNFYNFYCKCRIMFNYNNDNFIDYIDFSPEFGFYQNLGNNPAEACCKLYFLNKEILLDKINKNQLKYLSFNENKSGGEKFNLNINNDFNLELTNFRECFNERIEFKYGN